MTEGSGYKQLQSRTSLKDILSVATEFERTARDFYTALIPRVHSGPAMSTTEVMPLAR